MNLYSERRKRLLEKTEGNCMVLLFSGKAPLRSADENYPFCVDRSFYYLTGLDAEEMVLVLSRIKGKYDENIFILPYDEYLAKWVGGRMLAEEVTKISGIKKVNDADELDDHVSSMLERNNDLKVYIDLQQHSLELCDTVAGRYANELKVNRPDTVIADLFPLLSEMRLVKDESEIECLKKAIHITNLGLQEMMRNIKPGMNEMAMEGLFDYVLRQNVCRINSFPTIAASGKRATILHYEDNDQIMEDGELFLCDLGATYGFYCADISRTFPANGRFTERQREIYELVLEAQRIVKENARPGVTTKQLNGMVMDFYRKELPKHGLKKDVSEYYYHSCSHHLGLDTHDIDEGKGKPLEVGNVITDEPGLYIEDEGIGIRIEDDLLITEDGATVLSEEIIKDPDEIEEFMKGH